MNEHLFIIAHKSASILELAYIIILILFWKFCKKLINSLFTDCKNLIFNVNF